MYIYIFYIVSYSTCKYSTNIPIKLYIFRTVNFFLPPSILLPPSLPPPSLPPSPPPPPPPSPPRSNKPGHALYKEWCAVWEMGGGEAVPPGPKMFLVDQYLPVWVQCTSSGCRKWRKLPPSIELHHVRQEIVRCSSCERPEDEVWIVFDSALIV